MVLTQPIILDQVGFIHCLVSIPLWFLRNPIQVIREAETPEAVSIPLWFLRNARVSYNHYYKPITFPYHYGSYATE